MGMSRAHRIASTRHVRLPWWPATTLILAALAAAGVSGCRSLGGYSSAVVTPARSSAPPTPVVPAATAPAPSLASIVEHQLQPGHYAEGEQALRLYVEQHPQDRRSEEH